MIAPLALAQRFSSLLAHVNPRRQHDSPAHEAAPAAPGHREVYIKGNPPDDQHRFWVIGRMLLAKGAPDLDIHLLE
jgi:hypothetical protein